MGKNDNTYEKRRREVEKKRKANEKRERRRSKKTGADDRIGSGSTSVKNEATPVDGNSRQMP